MLKFSNFLKKYLEKFGLYHKSVLFLPWVLGHIRGSLWRLDPALTNNNTNNIYKYYNNSNNII